MRTVDEDFDAYLEKESKYWNDEYLRIFGEDPGISKGVDMTWVHTVQSKVIRHYIEQMKEAINDLKGLADDIRRA
jgi:hypothetical protein